MRVTQRTPDVLVIEEGAGTKIIIGSLCFGVGALFVLIGWSQAGWFFVIVGGFFALFGLKMLLFNRTRTHRFERWRGILGIESKGPWGSERRELPLDSIADIILEEIRNRGTSYYVYYVTRQAERIIWADSYDGSKENTLECFNAAREFLGFANSPVVLEDATKRS
jgi:hypothetical protein